MPEQTTTNRPQIASRIITLNPTQIATYDRHFKRREDFTERDFVVLERAEQQARDATIYLTSIVGYSVTPPRVWLLSDSASKIYVGVFLPQFPDTILVAANNSTPQVVSHEVFHYARRDYLITLFEDQEPNLALTTENIAHIKSMRKNSQEALSRTESQNVFRVFQEAGAEGFGRIFLPFINPDKSSYRAIRRMSEDEIFLDCSPKTWIEGAKEVYEILSSSSSKKEKALDIANGNYLSKSFLAGLFGNGEHHTAQIVSTLLFFVNGQQARETISELFYNSNVAILNHITDAVEGDTNHDILNAIEKELLTRERSKEQSLKAYRRGISYSTHLQSVLRNSADLTPFF